MLIYHQWPWQQSFSLSRDTIFGFKSSVESGNNFKSIHQTDENGYILDYHTLHHYYVNKDLVHLRLPPPPPARPHQKNTDNNIIHTKSQLFKLKFCPFFFSFIQNDEERKKKTGKQSKKQSFKWLICTRK